jgi:ferredoxin-NADP reductase/predicted pyridoxine 5'-phosphate oxidase superfamily flavin-nucleotide-binding protein
MSSTVPHAPESAALLTREAREFLERSPFLFFGTRSADGRCDLSPRGDVPNVLSLQPDGTLLMPDRAGNNRIDSTRNLLEQPMVTLVALNVGANRYLHIQGEARVSREAALLKAFAVRGEAPLHVMRITPQSIALVDTLALQEAGFWSPPAGGFAPMKLGAIIHSQIAHHSGRHVPPGLEESATLALLEKKGLGGVYAPLEPYVRGKAFDRLDPHTRRFLATAKLAAMSLSSGNGRHGALLLGGAEGFIRPLDEHHIEIRSRHEPLLMDPEAGGRAGGLLVRPGQNETLRLNGVVESCGSDGLTRRVVLRTEEIYFHCSNSFARSRMWRSKSNLAWSGTRKFICRERVQECEDVVSFVLSPEDDAPLLPFRAGQYVTVSPPENPALQRCYSLSNTPGDAHLRITVRKHESGALSRWLHVHIRAGAAVRLGAPRGRFTLDEGSSRQVALISAGVGLTPLVSMLAHLTRTFPGRPVWFIHGARNGNEHAMREFVESLARRNPGVRTHFAYSQPREADRAGMHYDTAGRIDIGTIAGLLDPADTDFYLCGPSEFMTSLRSALELRGAPAERIRMELFAAGEEAVRPRALPKSPSDGPPPIVCFTRSGKTVRWDPAAGTLLAMALKQGLPAPYICRSGDCQSCALPLEGGHVLYPEDLDVLPPEGYVLMCQAVPADDVKIEL